MKLANNAISFARQWLPVPIFALMLSACASGDTYAPVADIATIQPMPSSGKYAVPQTETLYAIAWRYGLDYRDLARKNRVHSPYKVYAGEQVYLRTNAPARTKGNAEKMRPQVIAQRTPDPQPSKTWMWPAEGKIVKTFAGLNKGINIAGHYGAPIYASNAGRVVYSGTGLRGYGNLIIIKHNNQFMSAYAHNSTILVSEDMVVSKGQKIAEMGNSGADQVMLHFEIRQNGKPVNPINMLKS